MPFTHNISFGCNLSINLLALLRDPLTSDEQKCPLLQGIISKVTAELF